jgi:hypothetical protein
MVGIIQPMYNISLFGIGTMEPSLYNGYILIFFKKMSEHEGTEFSLICEQSLITNT